MTDRRNLLFAVLLFAAPVGVAWFDLSVAAAVGFTLLLLLTLPGCMAVIGYNPTPEDVAAIQRGENPRDSDGQAQPKDQPQAPQRQGQAGQDPAPPVAQTPAPSQGVVLRWKDSATLVIEADGKAEVVALAGQAALTDHVAEQRALSDRMNRWTYGMGITLRYPKRDEAGNTIYRDTQGQLVATIE